MDTFVTLIDFTNTEIKVSFVECREADRVLRYAYSQQEYWQVVLHPEYTREQFRQKTLEYWNSFLRKPYTSHEVTQERASQLEMMADVQDFVFWYSRRTA